MPEGLLQRINREAGVDLIEALAELEPTDLRSVLLDVHRRAAARLDASSARSSFECSAVVEQIGFHVSLLRQWRPAWAVEVAITDFTSRQRLLDEQVLAPLAEQVPEAIIRINADRLLA